MKPEEFLALKFKKENCGEELRQRFLEPVLFVERAKIMGNDDLIHESTENIFQSSLLQNSNVKHAVLIITNTAKNMCTLKRTKSM